MNTEQQQYDSFVGRVLSFYLIINILNMIIKQSFPDLPYIGLLTPVFGVVYLAKLTLEYNYVKYVLRKIIILEFLFIVMITTSIIRYPYAFNDIVGRYVWVVAFCIPFLSFATKIEDIDVVVEGTKNANFIVLFFAIFSFMATLIRDGGFNYENYNMSLGYALLLPALYHLNKCLNKKIYLVFFLLELCIVIFYGSRGQLLSIAIYIIISFLSNQKTSKRIIYIISGVIAFSLFLSSWPTIGQMLLAPIVKKTGSRTLSMLMRGRFLPGSDRTDIWKATLDNICEKPFWGWGLGGELSYLHSYPHNIFLELCLHYGIIIGIIISLIICGMICKELFHYKTKKGLLILFCSCAFPLFLSGTYTEAPIAWLFLGYCFGKVVTIRGTAIKINLRD